MAGKINLPLIDIGATYREKIEWLSALQLISLSYDIATSKVIAVCKQAHALTTGTKVNIRDVSPYNYNAEFIAITVLDIYRFSYTPLSIPTTSARLSSDLSLTIPINLTGTTASLKIYSQITGILITNLTTSNGGIVLDVLKGVFSVFMDDAATATFPVPTQELPHRYTLEVFHSNGDTTLLITGFFSTPCSGRNSTVTSVVVNDATTIVVTALQGAPGVSGGSADNILDFAFSWGDVSPSILTSINGETVYKVEIVILTPFDVASTISIGDSGNVQRVFPTEAIDVLSAGNYSANLAYTYAAPTNINLYINLGVGNTQGNGLIFLYTTI